MDIAQIYKIEVFLPRSVLPEMMSAMADLGAGRIGNYDHCAAVTEVTGYWRPLPGANPTIGEVGGVSSEPEVKLEMDCVKELIPEVVQAIRRIHPYEEPVIHLVPLERPWFDHP
jgi:hypothetical protein